MEFVQPVTAHRQADQSTAVCGHKIDGIRRDFRRRHCEVAFIFAIFIIDDDDDPSLTNLIDSFFDRAEQICALT